MTGRAVHWVEDHQNKELLDRGAITLTRELRKAHRRSNKLLNVVDRNNAIAVFGPSQAGKSFLVSTLARPYDGDLVANFPGPEGKINYIRDINPEGAGESTGLVTRFTMNQADLSDDYPIKVELLSEYEIICILANSFLSGRLTEDQDHPARRLVESLEKAKLKSDETTNPPKLELEDMWDVQEYLLKEFGDIPYITEIKDYFDEISKLAVQLDFESRGELLSVFWGHYPEITNLYIKLAKGLQKLKFAKVAHLTTDSLFARQGDQLDKRDSIVDVATLHKINEETSSLKVKVGSEAPIELPRSIICALTAELTIPMQTCPHDLFQFTDLLDFPGARNPFKVSLKEELTDESANSENLITNLLLRGKVAFLFDKYVAAQEISAMLLCVGDGNMEVTSLPGLIDNWISETLGSNIQARSGGKNTLFFVLTKFDTLLIDTAATENTVERFKRRVGASLLEKFGKNKDKWVQHWSGEDQNFKNLFWLRNPNVGGQQYFKRDDKSGKENLVEDEKPLTRLNELKKMFLDTKDVTKYFLKPEKAWSEAIKPNDGGATYLIEELSKVCSKSTRKDQITTQINTMSKRIVGELKQYHISDNLDERLQAKINDFRLVEQEFLRLVEERRFSECIEYLMVDERSLLREFSRIPAHPDILPRFAKKAMELLRVKLKDFPSSVERRFNFKHESAIFVIEELNLFIEAMEIEQKILKSIGHLTFGGTADNKAFSASSISTNLINSTISSLRSSDEITISPWPNEVEGLSNPTRENFIRGNPSQTYSSTWLSALKGIVVENANTLDGTSINLEQNSLLGTIIKDIQDNIPAQTS